jgi:RNA polymerase sigma-70 factor, ECF subfamily
MSLSRAGGGEASDEVLAAAANAGDRGALEVLLARHLDRVHAICRRVTGHPEDALDATQ